MLKTTKNVLNEEGVGFKDKIVFFVCYGGVGRYHRGTGISSLFSFHRFWRKGKFGKFFLQLIFFICTLIFQKYQNYFFEN